MSLFAEITEEQMIRKFNNIVSGIENSILSISDEEIIAENEQDGIDTRTEAEKLRKSMLKVVEKFKNRLC